MSSKIKLIIFDCDGVVVDSEMIGNRVGAEVKTELGEAMTTEEHIRRFLGCAPTDPAYVALAEKMPPDFMEINNARRDKVFNEELKEVPGIRPTLEWLKNVASIKFCIASNGPVAKMKTTLGITKLEDAFEGHIFSAQNVGKSKPDPALFLYAAEKMNVAPENCLVIEDSPTGIAGAKAAGMRVWGFSGGAHMQYDFVVENLVNAGPNFCFQKMNELPRLLTLQGLV